MNDNIKQFSPRTDGKMTPKRFNKLVSNQEFKEALLIGWGEDGTMFHYNTGLSRKDALWLLENAKKDILE